MLFIKAATTEEKNQNCSTIQHVVKVEKYLVLSTKSDANYHPQFLQFAHFCSDIALKLLLL